MINPLRTFCVRSVFHTVVFTGSFFLAAPGAFAQQNKSVAEQTRLSADRRVERAIVNNETGTASLIKLSAPVKTTEAPLLLKELLQSDASVSFRPKSVQEDKNGITISRLQQYYNNVKVEHGVYSILDRGGNAEAFSGSYYALKNINVAAGITEAQALTYAKAFVGASKYAWEQAKEARDAETNPLKKQLYNAAYEKLLPGGQLVIVKDFIGTQSFDLSYKFDIYAANPLTRGYVYVNAHTGKIMLYDRIIKHLSPDQRNNTSLNAMVPEVAQIAAMNTATASAQNAPTALSVLTNIPTRYAGVRQIGTKLVSGNDPSGNGMPLMSSTATPIIPGSAAYVLIDDTHHSQAEQTYDLNGVGGLPVSVPVYGQAKSFTDVDNNWTLLEHNRGGQNGESENDDYAFDAHWGATVVYDFWNKIQNRKSYDNNNTSIMSYVHYGVAYDNAFWNGSVMTYGDGSYQGGLQAGFAPLTSLDVCGHEIGHGVCSFTSDLVYQGESGAMNEGFSDVWAACIENYALDSVDANLIASATNPNGFKVWSIGEQIDANDLVSGSTGANRPSSDPLSTALRYMDDPNKAGDPASYAEKPYSGTSRRWSNPNCTAPNLVNDQCGVHTNSGVLNHLMYILTVGKSGTVNTVTGPGENMSGAVDGTTYNVAGIGFAKSQKIMYLTEQLLTPSATFLDARNAGVLAAEILYGKCSDEWKQTVIAWNAVAVGPSSDTMICATLPKFTAAAISTVNEASAKSAVNCTDASTDIDLSVSMLSPGVPNAVTVTITPSGTATVNRDYAIQTTTFNYAANASGLQKTTISVYNDAEIEGNETIILAIHATDNASFTKDTTITITINDDDHTPIISNSRTNLLAEYFDATATGSLPAGWSSVDRLGAASTIAWRVGTANSYGFTTKAAMVSLNAPATLPVPVVSPTYDPSTPGNIVLRSPIVNATGFTDLKLTFRYAAGGEPDGNVPVAPLDYGRVVYSYDNITFRPFSDSGRLYGLQYTATRDSMILPGFLANKSFYLGFEWFNDDNVAVLPGFIIDSVILSGGRQKIETQVGEGVSEKQFSGKDIYYLSAQDGQLLAHITNNSADLGCVNAALTQAGNGANGNTITLNSTIYQRANRVLQITPSPANSTSTYTLSIYATAAELAGMTPGSLKIMKVRDGVALSGTIAAADGEIVTPIFEDRSADGYYSFTGNFTGFSQFALVLQSNLVAQNLLSFAAAPQENKYIHVSWSATNETNGAYTLERAPKGSNNFASINTQAMRGNAGVNAYSFDDYSAVANTVYQYRLRATENGTVRYSEIRLASVSGKMMFVEIAPNPSDGLFIVFVKGYRGEGQITVFDEGGRELLQRRQLLDADPRISIDLTKQPSGVYTMRLQTENNSEVFKLIVR